MRRVSKDAMSKGEPARGRVIRASEIGEYVWCRRAWWLGRVQGAPNAHRAALDAGTRRHLEHGRTVERAGRYAQIARWMFLAAVLLALAIAASLALGLH